MPWYMWIDLLIGVWIIWKVFRLIRGIIIGICNFVNDRLEKREIKKLTKALRKRKFVKIENTGEIVSTKNWVFDPERSNIYKP